MKGLLYNAIIINEGKRFKGYVEISENGVIAGVGEGEPSAYLLQANAIDMREHWLIPGVIDSHVHFREPGGEHKATIFTESRAAVAGGVTSFMEMPNTTPTTTTAEALEDKFNRARRDSLANYSFYIGATQNNLQTLKEMDYSGIPGIKLFMGSSTGGMLVDGERVLTEIFSLPALIAVHCEDESIIKSNTREIKELYEGRRVPGINWHPQIRSVMACYKSSQRAIELAMRYNTRLHIMHLTTAQELNMLSELKDNSKISAEICVAHLKFSDSDYQRLGTEIKCNPAVKSAMHRAALREAVKTGIIATVSTDHAPHTIEEKDNNLFSAPSGMPMIQFSLPVMLDLAIKGEWSVERVIEKMCHSQADIFGVEKRGYIRTGYAADLVEVSPTEETVVDKNTILNKCGWSPLEGETLKTRVIRTWVNGELVYSHTHGILDEKRPAQQLHFNR